jgi:transposase-like protein
MLDGSNALRKAVRDSFGEVALAQRCQVHKLRNVLDHLPDRQRAWVKASLQRAHRSAEVATARRLILDLVRRLETDHPSAAEGVREGLDDTLTVAAGTSARPAQMRHNSHPARTSVRRRCPPWRAATRRTRRSRLTTRPRES